MLYYYGASKAINLCIVCVEKSTDTSGPINAPVRLDE